MVSVLLKQYRRVLITVILFVSLLVIPAWAEQESLEVHFIDVGQGDSILLHSSAGTDILIDAGYPDNGKKVLEYIKGLGIGDLDLVISSHPHADHIGGLPDVLLGLPVKQVLDPGVVYPSGVYQNYLMAIREQKIPFSTVLAGDIIPVEDQRLQLRILAPYADQLDYGDDVNDVSIVIHATYGDISFLLVGDAGFPTEDKLVMGKVALKSTILKVGHHGSKYSTGELFLFSATPEVAIIQVGENDYGHPTEETLNRLNRQGIEIYRNDLHGTVVVKTDGKEYNITTEKVYEVVVDQRVNINTAPLGDLIELPGITIELGNAIVEYREIFGMILTQKELLRVDGMTKELLAEILPYIKFAD